MKVIIAGGRHYEFTQRDFDLIDEVSDRIEITEVVSGGATGADAGGEAWAHRNLIPVKRFPADWANKGKAAGYIRNSAMAEYADALIVFPGGRGTEHMLDRAYVNGLFIFDLRDKIAELENKDDDF